MIFVFIGFVSGFIVNGFGFPVFFYSILLPICIVESRANALLYALGAGMAFDLIWFSNWPKSTLWFVIVAVLCELTVTKFFNKRHVLTIVIVIAVSLAFIAASRYQTGSAESVQRLILMFMVNEMVAVILFYVLNLRFLKHRTI